MAKAPKAPVNDWQAEDDLRHLTHAAAVKADPKRHKAATALARQRIQEMQQAASVSPTDPAAGGDGMAGC